MADKINLTISSTTEDIVEYMSVIRLTTSALASKIGFDVEEIDDIKVSIGEACTNIIKHGLNDEDDSIDIEYTILEDRLTISVKDSGEGFDLSTIKEPQIDNDLDQVDHRGLGIFIIRALMDEVDINSDENGTEIIMTKIKIA